MATCEEKGGTDCEGDWPIFDACTEEKKGPDGAVSEEDVMACADEVVKVEVEKIKELLL